MLLTGMHTVADVVCIVCDTVVGWKYVCLMRLVSHRGFRVCLRDVAFGRVTTAAPFVCKRCHFATADEASAAIFFNDMGCGCCDSSTDLRVSYVFPPGLVFVLRCVACHAHADVFNWPGRGLELRSIVFTADFLPGSVVGGVRRGAEVQAGQVHFGEASDGQGAWLDVAPTVAASGHAFEPPRFQRCEAVY